MDGVRPEVAADHAAVRELHLRAFGEHGRSVADLVDALRSTFGPDRAVSLVAAREGSVVGHIMFTPTSTSRRGASSRLYRRFGFTPAGGLGFRKPSLRIPDAAFQAMLLPAYEPWMTGTLVYAQPFWQFDAVGLRDPNA